MVESTVHDLQLGLGYMPEKGFYAAGAIGLSYHYWDPDTLQWDPASSAFLFQALAGYTFPRKHGGFSIGLHGGYRSDSGFFLQPVVGSQTPELQFESVRRLETVATIPYLHISRGGDFLAFFVARAGFYQAQTSNRLLTLPRREYEKELQLVLIDSRPLDLDEDVRRGLVLGVDSELVWSLKRPRRRSPTMINSSTEIQAAFVHLDPSSFVRFLARETISLMHFTNSWLAWNAHIQAGFRSVPNAEVPIHELVGLGGPDGLRGYDNIEFFDRHAVHGVFMTGPWFLRPIPIELQAFFEVGSTFGETASGTKYSGGFIVRSKTNFGVRLLIPTTAFAFGPDGFRFSMTMSGAL